MFECFFHDVNNRFVLYLKVPAQPNTEYCRCSQKHAHVSRVADLCQELQRCQPTADDVAELLYVVNLVGDSLKVQDILLHLLRVVQVLHQRCAVCCVKYLLSQCLCAL